MRACNPFPRKHSISLLLSSQAVSSEVENIAGLSDADKILLPPSALQEMMARIPSGQMPSPMLFELSLPPGFEVPPKFTGILEFSAAEGCVVVPLWIMRSMGIEHGTELTVRSAELPKGTFAKLQPLSEEFATLQDPKGTLERAIAGKFATLSKGDSVAFEAEGHHIEMFVLEVLPEDAVCVIDTNLEVDFAPAAINEEEQRRRAAEEEQERLLRAQAEAAMAAAAAAAQKEAEAAAAAAEALAKHETEAAEAEERRSMRAQTSAELPPEPEQGADVATVVVRMPEGEWAGLNPDPKPCPRPEPCP